MKETKTQVVALTIIRQDRFLLGRRSLEKKVAPGYWCPISGKIEPGESEEQALIREAEEEIGVQVKPIKRIAEFDIEDRKSLLHWWLVELLAGEPQIKNGEHTELAWLTFDEILKLEPTFQEDISIYRSLLMKKPGIQTGLS
jgi:8-oxo-dGTP diphosphatase